MDFETFQTKPYLTYLNNTHLHDTISHNINISQFFAYSTLPYHTLKIAIFLLLIIIAKNWHTKIQELLFDLSLPWAKNQQSRKTWTNSHKVKIVGTKFVSQMHFKRELYTWRFVKCMRLITIQSLAFQGRFPATYDSLAKEKKNHSLM